MPLNESSLPLVATVLTLTITVSGNELNLGLVETEAIGGGRVLAGDGHLRGPRSVVSGTRRPGGDDGAESDVPGAGVAGAVPAAIAPWERFVIGLDEALEKFQRENPNGVSGAPARDSASDRPDSPPAAGRASPGRADELEIGLQPGSERRRARSDEEAEPDHRGRGHRRGHFIAVGRRQGQ